jgi:hypothetical protein
MYENSISKLEALFEDLTTQINASTSESVKKELNGKRGELLNEIRRLRRLQWEEENDRIEYDDER